MGRGRAQVASGPARDTIRRIARDHLLVEVDDARALSRGMQGLDVPEDYTPLPVARAKTWLLRIGCRRHPAIDWREVPGK